MNNKTQIAIICIIFFVGFILGVILNDIPHFTLDKEIQIFPIINSLITILLALSIPFWITKQLDDNKGIKSFLTDEVSLVSNELEKIKVKLEQCYKTGTLTKEDRQEINLLFEQLDKRIDIITKQLEFSYSNKSKEDRTELKIANSVFWKSITAGELMSSKFRKITPQFWKMSMESYYKYEFEIKMLAHKISKY